MVNVFKINWVIMAKIHLFASVTLATLVIVSLISSHSNTFQDISLVQQYFITHEPFIPDNPSDIPVRKPADIPRQFLIEEEDFCRRRDNLQVVSYVHSAISRVDQRMNTRRTWANFSVPGLNMTVVYMVGRAKNKKEEMIVEEESRLYHDIVQGNYTDHYHLLSYKALASLYWITRHCSHVPWTLHADDDLLVDTFLLQKLIHDQDDKSKEKFVCKPQVASVMRKGKWLVTKKEYPRNNYPSYCQGTIWLLATHLVPKLLEASKSVHFLWVDDVYITGMLAKRAKITIIKAITRSAQKTFDNKTIGDTLAWYHSKGRLRLKYWLDIINHYQPRQNASVAP